MERIRINTLEAGAVLDRAIFSLSGQKLLNSGIAITGRQIAALHRYGETEVILATGVDELVESGMMSRLDDSRLSVGQRLGRRVLTRHGQVVVDGDEELEQHHIDALRAGGNAFVAKDDPTDRRRERILMADALVEELEADLQGLDRRVKPAAAAANSARPPTTADDWPDAEGLRYVRTQAVEALRSYYARIEAGVTVEASSLDLILDDLTERLAAHPHRFTQLALLCPRREDYLPDHAYTTAVLAMAIAAQLNWPPGDLRPLGLAALLCDLGMLLVPERIRTGACELTDIDRSRVNRHPYFTLAMLQMVNGVAPMVKLAAIQHQERENGSGYPKGVRRDTICDYARVLATADAFAATTEPRSYRRTKLPYIAMEEMVRSAGAMTYWKPAVRALVQAAGLFPVGSYLRLSDGCNAHVIAANAKQVGRPRVQPLDAEGRPKGDLLDLSDPINQSLAIVRPLAAAME
ncbi:MAG: HD domain-containing phosphohydrolase [Phycisphaeraceae bacterium]